MENGDRGDLVTLRVTSNLTSSYSERRFPGAISVGDLKGKLELLTGASSRSMTLSVYDDQGAHVLDLTDNFASLSSSGVKSGMRIHVIDESQPAGIFDDSAAAEAERFQLSKEEYYGKEGTVHDYLRKNRLGRFSDEYCRQKEMEKKQALEKASVMKVGDRCQVTVPTNPVRRGTIAYLGELHFKPGVWVGVKYDEPLGKNDGSVKGKRYFECPPNYGGFVSPLDVEVGDFPEELNDALMEAEELEEL